MLFTLAEARSQLGRFVDQGSCKTSVANQRINEAVSRIMDMADWQCLRKVVRIWTPNRIFSLPSSVEKILWAAVDGCASRIYDQPYQFLASGPGDIDNLNCIEMNVIDKGDGWPVMYDIPDSYTLNDVDYTPSALPLLVRSTSADDTSLKLTVIGYNAKGEEISEEVAIQQWDQGVEGQLTGLLTAGVELSSTSFTEITRVLKPATTGHISMYAVDPATSFFSFLAKYRPAETIPSFRRYGLTANPVSTDDTTTYVLAIVKFRAVPLADDTDIVPIDSMQALKLMIMAIREENSGNLQGAFGFEAQAKRLMEEREMGSKATRGTSIVLDFDYDLSLGSTLNHDMIL